METGKLKLDDFENSQKVRSKMSFKESFAIGLLAMGRKGMPKSIHLNHNKYNLAKIMKHDFYAGTALYESANDISPKKIVLKINRTNTFLAIPMQWLSEYLADNEVKILKKLKDVESVPKLLDRFGKTGFIYEFIEGQTIDNKNLQLPEDFFENLKGIVEKIHSLNIVYFDMNKRSNILLGDDSKPKLIDFQISAHIPERMFISKNLTDRIRKRLQQFDIYHIYKHKRKFLRHLMTEEEYKQSLPGKSIKIHRAIADLYKKIRRNAMRTLYTRGLLVIGDDTIENAPDRFMKKKKKDER